MYIASFGRGDIVGKSFPKGEREETSIFGINETLCGWSESKRDQVSVGDEEFCTGIRSVSSLRISKENN